MKKREVVTCPTTSLLVFFYVVELIFRPNFETFSPPLLSSSLYPAQFTIYLFFGLVFGPALMFIVFSRPFLATTIVTGKLTFVSRMVPGDISISPFTPQFVLFCSRCPAAFIPEGFRTLSISQTLTTLIFFFCRCVRLGWKCQSGISLALRLRFLLTPPFPEATRLPGGFFQALHQ
jgi:hypothetical protein